MALISAYRASLFITAVGILFGLVLRAEQVVLTLTLVFALQWSVFYKRAARELRDAWRAKSHTPSLQSLEWTSLIIALAAVAALVMMTQL